jgi:hypothetical protein
MHAITRRIGQSTRHTSMSNRIARWVSRLGLLALVLSLGLLSGPATPAAAANFSVNAFASGTGLYIKADYSSTINWNVQVSTGKISYKTGNIPYFDTSAALPPRVSTNTSIGASYSHFFGPLAANLNYNYIINGGGGYAIGSVTTKNRQLTVTFTKLDVIDDGDFWVSGEDTFHFNINGTWVFQTAELYPNSPETVTINQTFTSLASSSSLKLAVQGVDDDCDSFDGICSYGLAPDFSSGWDYQHDWQTAQSNISYGSLGAADANEVTKAVTFETPQSSYYPKFKVYATVTAKYF